MYHFRRMYLQFLQNLIEIDPQALLPHVVIKCLYISNENLLDTLVT